MSGHRLDGAWTWVELECQMKWAEWFWIGSMVLILCDGMNVHVDLIVRFFLLDSLPYACWKMDVPRLRIFLVEGAETSLQMQLY